MGDNSLGLGRGKRKDPRTALVMRKKSPTRLGLALKGVKAHIKDLDEALALVQKTRKQLVEAHQGYNGVLQKLHDDRRHCQKRRREMRKRMWGVKRQIFNIAREIRAKDTALARLEHEAKIGHLLDSTKSLESLVRAYLNPGEWDLIQRRRQMIERRELKRQLTMAARKGGDANRPQRLAPGTPDNATAALAPAGAAAVATDNGNREVQS